MSRTISPTVNLAVGAAIDQQIEELDHLCRFVQGRLKSKKRMHLSFDEWNVWYRARSGDDAEGHGAFAPHLLEEVYNLEDALVVAQFLNSFIRHADSVKIANIAQIVNVIAPILTRGDEMVLQPIYYAIAAYANRREGVSLQVNVEGPKANSKSHPNAPQIDASAILEGRQLHVFLVNRSADQGTDVRVELAGLKLTALTSGEIVTGTDPKAINDFGAKPQVVAEEYDGVCFECGAAVVSLPALSFFAGTFSLAG